MFGKYILHATLYSAEYTVVAYISADRTAAVLSDLKWVVPGCRIHLSKPVSPVTDQRNSHSTAAVAWILMMWSGQRVCFVVLLWLLSSSTELPRCSAGSASYGFAHLSPWLLLGLPFCCRYASFPKLKPPSELMAWP